MYGHILRSKFKSICPGDRFSSFQNCHPVKIQNHRKIWEFWKTLAVCKSPCVPLFDDELHFLKFQKFQKLEQVENFKIFEILIFFQNENFQLEN